MKKTKNKDLFTDLILDEEEKQLEQAFERGEFEENSSFPDTKKMLETAATQFKKLHRSRPITIRINQLDLIKVKAKAKKHNIPYQTLISVLIHQFAKGDQSLKI
jgi:predicted DNA binding CopG/RHH family protein